MLELIKLAIRELICNQNSLCAEQINVLTLTTTYIVRTTKAIVRTCIVIEDMANPN